MTTLGIMQPYFLPYIGYFQLIEAVDCFVIYDNIKYTKKGWINRNRMLRNGSDVTFTLPLRQGSDYLDIRDREIASDFNRGKLLNAFRESYRRAPQFSSVWPVLEEIVMNTAISLFEYVRDSITRICIALGIETRIVVSSSINIDHDLRGQEKVIALCEEIGASRYINSIGGLALYCPDVFRSRGIELEFLRPEAISYSQFEHDFVPWLSIIDVMMFNRPETVRTLLSRWQPVVGAAQ